MPSLSVFCCVVRELPQKPAMVVGADFQQVAPVGGGTKFKDLCEHDDVFKIELDVVHRTDDETLKAFLSLARVKQPARVQIRSFCW